MKRSTNRLATFSAKTVPTLTVVTTCHAFFSFITKRKEAKERCENVLSSEVGCPIIVIIQRTRYAQTTSHVDLLVSLRDTRIEKDSDNSTPSKDLLVRNVFEREARENMEHEVR